MPRKGVRDMAKERHWRGVIKSWHSSGITAAEFCRRHGHKYFQFQDWRKIIQKRDAQTAAMQRKGGSSKLNRNQHSARATRPRQPALDFVQASITDSVRASSVLPDESKVEVVLPCGTVLRITTTCPPEFLSTVVAALENR